MTEDAIKSALKQITDNQIAYMTSKSQDADFIVYTFKKMQSQFTKKIVTANSFAAGAGLVKNTFVNNIQFYNKREAAFNGERAGGGLHVN